LPGLQKHFIEIIKTQPVAVLFSFKSIIIRDKKIICIFVFVSG